MFKLMFISLLALVSTQVFAESSIKLGGPSDTLEMNAEQSIFREVVSYEPYQTICYREIYYGTRTECGTVYETRCTKVPYECHQEPTQYCSEVPDTRSEAYSCIEYRQVINHVFDHSVRAAITVVKTASAHNFDLNDCLFGVTLNDDFENYYAYCKTSMIKLKVIERGEKQSGHDKERKIKLALDFSSLESLNALQEGLSNLNFANGLLTFQAANLETAKNFKLSIKLIRNKFLRKDATILNQDLKVGQFTTKELSDGKFLISINLKNLAPAFNPKRKHTVSLSLKTMNAVDVTGSINRPSLTNELTGSRVLNE